MADRAEVVFTFRDTSPTNSGSGASDGTASSEAKKPVSAIAALHKTVADTVSEIKNGDFGSALKSLRGGLGKTLQSVLSGNFGSAKDALMAAKSAGSALLAMVNPVTATIAVIAGLGYAAKKASDALRIIGQEVGGLSPQVVAGRARIDQQKFEQDRQRAKRFGSRIARQEEVDARFDRAMTELKDDLTELFMPLTDAYLAVKSGFTSVIEAISGVEENTRKTDNPFTAIDGLFQKFAKLESVADNLRWLEKRKGKMGASANELAAAGIAINGLPAGAN